MGNGEDDDDAISLIVAGEPKERVKDETDRFVLSDQFQACLPEKLAAIKLRAFIDEVKGAVAESEPGHILVRLDLPSKWKPPESRSGLFNFLSVSRGGPPKGREPIELELQMQKIDANMVLMQIVFRPMKEFMPTDERLWASRCELYYSLLRKYIMPE